MRSKSEYDQYVGFDLVKPFIIIIGAMILLEALMGCVGERNTKLTVLQTEQSMNGVVIARENYQQLEMLAVTQTFNAERILIPIPATIAGSMASAAEPVEWTSSCDQKLCTISNTQTGDKRTINTAYMITPLQWSPDGKLAFFIRQVKGFRLPVRCYLEDERDLIVYDPMSQSESRVITLCGGYPYSSLHWYRIAH